MPKGETLALLNEQRAEEMRAAQLKQYVVLKNGCWKFTGTLDKDGYGKLKRFGKTIRAHRVFYTHHKGKIPRGKLVLHHCDFTSCVRPSHLYVGTQFHNEADKDARGRRPLPPWVIKPRGREEHPMYGKPMLPHVADALRKANIGRSLSAEHRRKLSVVTAGKRNGMYGRRHTRAARLKMSGPRAAT